MMEGALIHVVEQSSLDSILLYNEDMLAKSLCFMDPMMECVFKQYVDHHAHRCAC